MASSYLYCGYNNQIKLKTMSNADLTKSFIEDYNSLLEGLNDELDGVGISANKMITKLSQVKIANLECDDYLAELYCEIVKN